MKKTFNLMLSVLLFTIFLVSCTTLGDLTASGTYLGDKKSVVEAKGEQAKAEIKDSFTKAQQDIESFFYQPIVKIYELMGYNMKITADKGVAYVEYPSIIAESDIDQAVKAAVAVYGDYLKDITYSVKDGIITVNYPESYGEAEFALAEKIIAKELPGYISAVLVQQNKISEKSIVEQVTETVSKIETKKDEAKSESVKTTATPVASTTEPSKTQESKVGGLNKTHIMIISGVVIVGLVCILLFRKKKDE